MLHVLLNSYVSWWAFLAFSYTQWYQIQRYHSLGFHHTERASQIVLVVKKLLASAGDIRDTGSMLGLGRSRGVGSGNPLQCPCLENPMDKGAWWATVTKSPTHLSD